MQIHNKFLIFAALSILLSSVARGQNQAKFTLVIDGKGDRGMKEAGELYRMGISEADFRKTFGPPDREVVNTSSLGPKGREWYYYHDGLFVQFKDGVTFGYGFYFVSHTVRHADIAVFQAADVQTDKGVKAGCGLREFAKVYGEPTQDLGEGIYLFAFGIVHFDESGNLESILLH